MELSKLTGPWKIGTFKNIPVFVDVTVLIPVIMFSVGELPDLLAVGANIVRVLVFYIIILIHELGHVNVASILGVNCESVRLFVFGGVASMELPRHDARKMLLISMGGPLVNMILLFMTTGILVTLRILNSTIEFVLISPLLFFAIANLVILVFNILPIFPLDGGRILQALLHIKVGRRKAAKFTSTLGLILLLPLAILFVKIGSYISLMLIPMLVYANLTETKINFEETEES